MGFKDISQIAGSAMAAQTVRMNTIASNLANANAVATTEADGYRARKPVFAALVGDEGVARVQVLDVVQSSEPLRRAHEPDNPLADADGMVYYANVNEVAEMADMMAASRAFETNVEVMGRIKSMQASLLKLGEG
ncbi:flagellar basal body rod protein FlgC [Massilia sp. YIM B02443]|uniref:flagellar basal body rod protein FlgC n=1 Tax=Massilia sp. YIM B02443 TaxID=3050127 RepID=UPI0025B720C3|nr:flagellar basal body rod protein FlgC [Massilia sp. YIM B02443]MDN4035985.1 flagellar basal body rod protein FlgC [Massilia sp. YIM B02443]